MREEDLSIGYEVWARPELGVNSATYQAYERIQWPKPYREFVDEYWQAVQPYSLLGEFKSYTVFNLAKTALALAGDFAEFGCFRGGTSYMLGQLIKQSDSKKKMYMCDCFDKGLPEPDRAVDKAYEAGTMAFPVNKVKKVIDGFDLSSQCIPRPGLFSDTFADFKPKQQFAMVHLDCDLYQGTQECLEFIYPRLSEGAPVIVDDYYDESHGVMKALNQFAEKNNIVVHLSSYGQAYWIKGETPDQANAKQVKIGISKLWMSTEAARDGLAFLDVLEALLKDRRKRVDRLERFIAFCRDPS